MHLDVFKIFQLEIGTKLLTLEVIKKFAKNSKSRYLRDYLELDKNKNISKYLLFEISSFPGSFEQIEGLRGFKYS